MPSALLRRGKVPQKIYWEGNILNKISKKIVALATMAAFVLTLVPAAAFAAGNTATFEPTKSYVVTDQEKVSVDVTDPVKINFEINDNNGDPVKDNAASTGTGTMDTYFWVTKVNEDGTETVTRSVEYSTVDGTPINDSRIVVLDNGWALKTTNMYYGQSIQVAFTEGGTYKIHAGADLNLKDAAPTTTTGLALLNTVLGQDTIEVDAPDQEVTSVEFGNIVPNSTGGSSYSYKILNDADPATSVADKDHKTLTAKMDGDFVANGIATAKVTATVKNGANAVGAGEEFTLKTQKGLNLSTDKVVTDRNGQISFTFTMDPAKNYKIYMENDDLKITLNINRAEASEAEYIETVVNNAQTLEAETAPANFADAVQFSITDKNGNELGDTINEPAETPDTDYVTIVSKPDKSDLVASDIALEWDTTNKVWTLDYVGGEAKDDLIAGEYTVEISLESGNKAQATFTLAKFGDITGINVKMVGAQAGRLDDTVVAGETIYGDVYVVDANGIEKPADEELGTDNYSVSMLGRAITSAEFNAGAVSDSSVDHDFKIVVDNSSDIVGTVIKVKAFDSVNGKLAQKELTVVDGLSEYSLAFDSDNGPANQDNKVNVTVVDEEGNTVDVDGANIYAYVESASVADANVEANVSADATVNNGKGVITLYSDVETSADIVVAVVDPMDKNNAIYAGTLEYTFGPEDIHADTTVVMTIDSTDYVVNNDIVTGDAAPYVDSNWRTMVPFRVLGETFGATVNWDQDAQTVTYTLGNTELTMTIGEDTYTVNGEEKTMDTAPVLSGDRTYVPVRFVAEALGYTVTPLQDANGLTASVVFQK